MYFPNSDNVRHQVYSFSPAKRFQLPLYAGTPAAPVVFDRPGVVAIGCNIHDQMSAYLVVVDMPYFARDRDGNGGARLASRRAPTTCACGTPGWRGPRRRRPAP